MVGFLTFILITILGIALFYSATIQDRIKDYEVQSCMNKIITNAESVFYYGAPSRATISCYLPESIIEITIAENTLIVSTTTSAGISKTPYSSKVPIAGNIAAFSGTRNIRITAEQNYVTIDLV